ncbi:methyltransferase domain-containing protein [Actinotignum timonense]|uniref:methyltransferase domain-containing protein n=1 Tax=Actinotignum timonense TaxID=1870995 RepID=UPI00254F93E1|nr:methyltransferase domain-containing protein [Actinotignum timonense]MDK6905821.1 methyltransferase domain-containing protein [Actinotignum timonense]
MGEAYPAQVADKEERLAELLAPFAPVWLPPALSPESHFRNKAKLAVGGSAQAPTLGILDRGMRGVDLRACGLYEEPITAALPVLTEFIGRARLTPFDVPSGRGELKNILLTAAPSGELLLRFVLRSTESVVRIRKHLPWLRAQLPNARVISVNLLPQRAALVEGEEEIVLTAEDTLPFPLGTVTLYLTPRSFFQTNTTIARAMYAQARDWAAGLEGLRTVWDLYCGVGGFALHVAGPGRRVTGVEISEAAVDSARRAAANAGSSAQFFAGDAARAAGKLGGTPDLLIVNPPRRGLTDLTEWIAVNPPRWLIYSSCNPTTLAKDLGLLDGFAVHEARLMDMFPQTGHMECMVLAERVD